MVALQKKDSFSLHQYVRDMCGRLGSDDRIAIVVAQSRKGLHTDQVLRGSGFSLAGVTSAELSSSASFRRS